MTMTSTDPDLSRPDYAAIKGRQQAAWASGDYARIGVTLQIVGETLAEAMDLPAGASALDVAAGNGNATLAAARRWAEAQAELSARARRGRAVNLDPSALVMDMLIELAHLPPARSALPAKG